MSFLRRMLGLESAEELRARGDALFERQEYGNAKLAYERALDRLGRDSDRREALEARVVACCDGIAEQRIAEGDRQREAGHLDLAQAEYEGAVEVARDTGLLDRARSRLDDLERSDAVTQAAAPPEALSDEERLAVVAGSWEGDQADEYEALGEALDRGLLAMMDERPEEARAILEELLEKSEAPRYLWLEVARARLLCDDTEGGAEALRRFLGEFGPHEGGEARLAAHQELAHLADERGDFEAAVAEYEAAIEALGEDPRPYLWLGRFLRHKGHAEEAVEVIESAIAVMDSARPDWRVLQELGLAQAEAGRDDAAIETLEEVLRVLASRRHLDFPPDTAVALARLHEKQGRLERAADLYRQLTQGSHREGHAVYYREGARVLEALGLEDEARRMRQRAEALEPS